MTIPFMKQESSWKKKPKQTIVQKRLIEEQPTPAMLEVVWQAIFRLGAVEVWRNEIPTSYAVGVKNNHAHCGTSSSMQVNTVRNHLRTIIYLRFCVS